MEKMYIGLAAGVVFCYFGFSFFVRLLVNFYFPKINKELTEMNKTLKRIEKQNAKILSANEAANPAKEQPKENS